MTEPNPAVPAQEQTQQPAETQTPPWGDDFDPARAWHTITSLREREKELSRQVLTPEQREQLAEYGSLVEASKSEQQRKDEALAATAKERDEARAEALRYRVAAMHGIGSDDLELLGAGSEEQLTARAQRIAALRNAAAVPPATPLPKRPTEQLQPGATPAADKSEEDQLYEALYGASN